ncbi:hypothetical protein [Litchfieldella xinjiangensis]|uniref:hypothetical protein n=1 Tax=Litchfieldella xinjiangensis TaxID=1166948 RepID=UPI0005BB8B5E|nr:hypothetical protein [Halomonas xinjiangensis]
MAQYLVDDRRRKPEGEHLSNVVKVRFTDTELELLQASASMSTEGRLAPYLHDLVLEAHEARRARQAQLLADLAEGKPLDDQGREALEALLARMAEQGLMRSLAQQLTA